MKPDVGVDPCEAIDMGQPIARARSLLCLGSRVKLNSDLLDSYSLLGRDVRSQAQRERDKEREKASERASERARERKRARERNFIDRERARKRVREREERRDRERARESER